MFCRNCGTVLQAAAKFCVECGTDVQRETVDKPISFEEFMASRTNGSRSFSSAASSPGESSLDVQFQAAQKNKQKERSTHFKSKGRCKKKGDETVKINVGLVDLNSEYNELKIKRASSLPIPVRKSATDVTVKRAAIEKHMAHNKSLRTESAQMKTEWILLYPDLDVVFYVPGTKDCFSVEKYKDSIGKAYNRVYLYLCRKSDYDAVINSEDTDTEQTDLEKTLLDSSGEVILNIPDLVPSAPPLDTTMTTQSVRKAPSVASSDSLAAAAWAMDVASTSAASEMEATDTYNTYCEVMDELPEEQDPEIQEAIFQSARARLPNENESESLETVLRLFENEKVAEDDSYQIIRVRRKHLWEDTVRAVTKTGFRCNVKLKVHFIGEEAEDEGGPLREFLRLVMYQIADNCGVLQGPDNRKTFCNNPLLLEKGAYYCAGVVSGISLQQGGPGLHCLADSTYDYFLGGPSSTVPELDDVADYETKLKIEKITSARDQNELTQSINEESNFLIECGISKLTWSLREKENLKSLLCKSSVIYQAKAALDQFVEGLQSVGILSYMKRYPGVLRKVFCNPPTPLSVTQFRNLLTITYSEAESNAGNFAREGEEATILWWEEYLDKLDNSDPEGLLPQLLVFITGADNIPILGFPNRIHIDFFDYQPGIRRFPTASTCGLLFTLPRGVPSYEEFESLITQALKEGSHDFGKL